MWRVVVRFDQTTDTVRLRWFDRFRTAPARDISWHGGRLIGLTVCDAMHLIDVQSQVTAPVSDVVALLTGV